MAEYPLDHPAAMWLLATPNPMWLLTTPNPLALYEALAMTAVIAGAAWAFAPAWLAF
jgi:hypothetical protein